MADLEKIKLNDSIKVNSENYKLNSDLRNFSIKANLEDVPEVTTRKNLLVDGKEVAIPPTYPTSLTRELVEKLNLKNATELVLPEGITRIEPLAFAGGSETLKKIVLPKGFREIGTGAICHCENLRELKFLGNEDVMLDDGAIDLRHNLTTKDNSILVIRGRISALTASSILGASKIVINGNVDKLSLRTYDTKTILIDGNVDALCDNNLCYGDNTSVLEELVILGNVERYRRDEYSDTLSKVKALHIGGKKPDNLLRALDN